MAEEAQAQVVKRPMRRTMGHKKGGKSKNKPKVFQGSGERVKVDKRMQKLYRKRARDYNSDDDDDDDDQEEEERPRVTKARKAYDHSPVTKARKTYNNEVIDDDKPSDEEVEEPQNEQSDDEDGEILPGITKFVEGCNAFRAAFKKIKKTNISDELLGPVLSAHKKLLAEKLAEEDAERKVKGEAKKEKHLISEKGHVKPANFLDLHEKFLIGVATKGVVKLFNAVNKARVAQKGLNPSRSKDAKALSHRRKNTFFSELHNKQSRGDDSKSQGTTDGEGPSWAPLRDNYMLTNPKLKDWDKMEQDTTDVDGVGRMASDDSSSDEED